MIEENAPITAKKHIFIVGLHRSGTTLLADYLKEHAEISGFENTGFPMNEGQFLQTVFPIAKVFGGPGKFGFDKRSHLTENSSNLTSTNKIKLHNEWNIHWDLSKNYLLEKSPPSLLKTRFLQEIFPNSYFIYIKRDPIAVSYATQKMSTSSIISLLKHWIKCNEIFIKDSVYLNHLHTITYEDLVMKPSKTISAIYKFLELTHATDQIDLADKIDENINKKYFSLWEEEYNKFSWFEKINLEIINYKLKKFKYTLKVI